MAKLTQVEQANILERVLASHLKAAEMERWVLQLLEALKQVADLTKQEGMTIEELRAITLEIRYNLRKGPRDSKEFEDDKVSVK